MMKKKIAVVLLVEDDSYLAEIYSIKLKHEGFSVIVAVNGLEGLKKAKAKKPDAILLDILLPKMDGFGVLTELKQDETTKRIPVILLTNLGQKEDIERGFKLGAADYLIKAHFKPSETVKKLKNVLR